MLPKVTRLVAVLCLCSSHVLAAAPQDERADSAIPVNEAKKALEKGVSFLLSKQEGAYWTMRGYPELGMTSMASAAVLSSPVKPDSADASMKKTLEWIASNAQDDGGIHQGRIQNYVTSVSVMALSKGDAKKYQALIEKAARFIESLQATGDQSDPSYGGVSYGGQERADLSNLQYALEALKAAGVEEDDEAIQNALVFLTRSQNRSESNDTKVKNEEGQTVVSGNDGGGIYYPGNSAAGYEKQPDGTVVASSYGSMTYALLRGYLFAGLSKDDPRVKAAVDWISKNYTVERHPGFQGGDAYAGLYYYYYAMAKALSMLGIDEITDADGKKHDWRKELAERLISLQNEDGSWANDKSARWWENEPVLATSYAVQALAATLPDQG